jgi:uncharacterized membrane protein YdfJ with MMPL/SSD domain
METEEAVADADGSVSEEPAPGQTPGTAAEKHALADDVEEQKKVGLGLIGTTGIMLAIIVLLVVLGTVALSPRRKGNL